MSQHQMMMDSIKLLTGGPLLTFEQERQMEQVRADLVYVFGLAQGELHTLPTMSRRSFLKGLNTFSMNLTMHTSPGFWLLQKLIEEFTRTHILSQNFESRVAYHAAQREYFRYSDMLLGDLWDTGMFILEPEVHSMVLLSKKLRLIVKVISHNIYYADKIQDTDVLKDGVSEAGLSTRIFDAYNKFSETVRIQRDGTV